MAQFVEFRQVNGGQYTVYPDVEIFDVNILTLERLVFYYLHGIGTALHKMRRITKFVFLLLKVNEET